MPQVKSFKLDVPVAPGSEIVVTDAYVFAPNAAGVKRRGPIKFKQFGQYVDADGFSGLHLENVEIESFVRSSFSGQLHKLNMVGTLAAEKVTVSDRFYAEYSRHLNALESKVGPMPTGFSNKSATRVLEPGSQVAVGNFPDAGRQMPVVEPPPPPAEAQMFEQGLGAGIVGGNKPPKTLVMDSNFIPVASPEAVLPSASPLLVDAAAAASSGNPMAHWKENPNLNFQQQKRKVMESTDRKFLEYVVATEPHKGLVKIANESLAKLK